MKSNISPLKPDTFYHIYNRGINRENLFKAPENYDYFLRKYNAFITPIADTYAYCLLKNHFHFLVKTKSETLIQQNLPQKDKPATALISLQFSHLFNGYTQGINKVHSRTGGLFETPFRRKTIPDDNYLRRLIFYIHHNPEKHKLTTDFRCYPYSSYSSYLSESTPLPVREEVFAWFGGKADFLQFHLDLQTEAVDSIEF